MILLCFLVLPAFALNGTLNGDGTVDSPWLVDDYSDLKMVGDDKSGYLYSDHYRLTANINASLSKSENNGEGFVPIPRISVFTGSLHGAGHVIYGLYINRPLIDGGALIRRSRGAVIDSLGVIGDVTGMSDIGMIVGFAEETTITHSYSSGVVTGRNKVGGMVGKSDSLTLIDSYSTAMVWGGTRVGGLVGDFPHGTMRQCYYSGIISYGTHGGPAVASMGALVGYQFSSEVTASHWYGDIVGVRPFSNTFEEMCSLTTYVGWDFDTIWELQPESFPTLRGVTTAPMGAPDTVSMLSEPITLTPFLDNDLYLQGGSIVAKQTGYSHMNRLRDSLYVHYKPGIVIQPNDTLWGGITYVVAPYSDTISIDSYDDLKLIGNNWQYPLGGVYRLTTHIDASPSKNENDGKGFTPIGSLAQRFTGDFNGAGYTISGLFIHSNEFEIGLFGSTLDAIIDSVTISGDITGYSHVGSLVGMAEFTQIFQCHSRGSVTGESRTGGLIGELRDANLKYSSHSGTVSGKDNVGGLVGYNVDWSQVAPIIEYCYSSGSVSGENYVGGLVGRGSNIEKSYSSCAVSGEISVGGLVGEGSNIDYTYSVGPVSGKENVGGLVGYSPHSITHSYSSSIVKGDSNVGGVVGRGAFQGVGGSYWNKGAVKNPTNDFGIGLTSDEMKLMSSFEPNFQFGFREWVIHDSVSYPGIRGINNTPVVSKIQPQQIKEGGSLTVLVSMTDASDADNNANMNSMDSLIANNYDGGNRQQLSIVVGAGNNYTSQGSTIHSDAGFIGELLVPIQVFDGGITSHVVIMTVTVVDKAPESVSSGEEGSSSAYSAIQYSSDIHSFQSSSSHSNINDTTPDVLNYSSSFLTTDSLEIAGINGYTSEKRDRIFLINNKSRATDFISGPVGESRFTLYSVHGSVVKEGWITQDYLVDFSSLKEGVYVIRFW